MGRWPESANLLHHDFHPQRQSPLRRGGHDLRSRLDDGLGGPAHAGGHFLGDHVAELPLGHRQCLDDGWLVAFDRGHHLIARLAGPLDTRGPRDHTWRDSVSRADSSRETKRPRWGLSAGGARASRKINPFRVTERSVLRESRAGRAAPTRFAPAARIRDGQPDAVEWLAEGRIACAARADLDAIEFPTRLWRWTPFPERSIHLVPFALLSWALCLWP